MSEAKTEHNTIDALREHLFQVIRNASDPNAKFNAERSRMVIDASRAIIETAKAETDRIRVIGRPADTDFIPVVDAPKRIGGPK